MSQTSLDFGYPWWLSYGHAALLAGGLVVLAIGFRFHWSRWAMVILGLFTVWAAVAAVLIHRFDINGIPSLPTQSFLRSGTGRVLDLGAGTGRSSIMVLTARPQATLVASDLFGDSFDQHFGEGVRPEDRLWANLKIAGVDARARVETADMRKLPFDAGTFDAAVSAYAMDHLGRNGAKQALGEAHRVIKPGGDLLLILINNDAMAKFAFGPLLAHGGPYGPAWWRTAATDAGFQIGEEGTSPLTLYFLLNRPG